MSLSHKTTKQLCDIYILYHPSFYQTSVNQKTEVKTNTLVIELPFKKLEIYILKPKWWKTCLEQPFFVFLLRREDKNIVQKQQQQKSQKPKATVNPTFDSKTPKL